MVSLLHEGVEFSIFPQAPDDTGQKHRWNCLTFAPRDDWPPGNLGQRLGSGPIGWLGAGQKAQRARRIAQNCLVMLQLKCELVAGFLGLNWEKFAQFVAAKPRENHAGQLVRLALQCA